MASSPAAVLKRLLVGRPFRSDRLSHELLPKRIALPIFASDPLSSVTHATQEILLILTLGGLAYLYLAPWVGPRWWCCWPWSTFAVDRGEVFGFLGPSGAGKSTTQKILTGLLTGHGGRVAVWDRDPADWGSEYYQRIGVSFELPNHYQKLTALENLQFFASLYSGPTEDPMVLLETVDLAASAHTRVGQFSKGMQMRLVFARALLHHPELLFLDEPTSGMDPVNARRVKDVIRELREQGRTVFLTTHDMATAEELCDRVAFVVDGRIAALDTPTEHKVSRSRRTVRVTYRNGGRLDYKDFPLDGLADDETFRVLAREHHVEALHSQEASLEDVFIDVTGRSLA